MQKQHPVEYFQSIAVSSPELHWFAIADSAQDITLPEALKRPSRSLFDAEPGSPLAEKSPHLVELSSPVEGGPCWRWISRYNGVTPSITILASKLSFSPLFSRLKECAEVILPDGETMFFAYWDPAILGTLFGQNDDSTLHVAGPVLTAEQRQYFAGMVHAWWYWDRKNGIHEVQLSSAVRDAEMAPFSLSQAQVDDLVEASLPDHVLYFVRLNQPHLLSGMQPYQQYEFVRDEIRRAQLIGLEHMRDIINYVCVMLIYKERAIHNDAVAEILRRVQSKELNFDEAMQLFP